MIYPSLFLSFPPLKVCAENKVHSVYIWIYLKPGANIKECVKVAATLQDKVKQTCGPHPDDDDEIFAGVGFGCNLYKLVRGVESSCILHF